MKAFYVECPIVPQAAAQLQLVENTEKIGFEAKKPKMPQPAAQLALASLEIPWIRGHSSNFKFVHYEVFLKFEELVRTWRWCVIERE